MKVPQNRHIEVKLPSAFAGVVSSWQVEPTCAPRGVSKPCRDPEGCLSRCWRRVLEEALDRSLHLEQEEIDEERIRSDHRFHPRLHLRRWNIFRLNSRVLVQVRTTESAQGL